MFPSHFCRCACMLLAIGSMVAGEPAQEAQFYKDRIVTIERTIQGMVVEETIDTVFYLQQGQAQPFKVKRSILKEPIFFEGMGEGLYKVGMEAKKTGNYLDAATRFQELAAIGQSSKRQWALAYGLFLTGDSFELADKFDLAAKSYNDLCERAPKHPLWLDARYRQGLCLARMGGASLDEAKKLIEAIKAYGKEYGLIVGLSAVSYRSNAIEAAIQVAEAKVDDAQLTATRVQFQPGSDKENLIHWKRYWANFLLEKDQKRALEAFKELEALVASDPAAAATCAIGYARALAETGQRAAAIVQFSLLDALPYGSADQRCIAQYHLGRLLIDMADALQKADPDKSGEQVTNNRLQAISALKACANAPSNRPERQLGKDLLEKALAVEAKRQSTLAETASAVGTVSATKAPVR